MRAEQEYNYANERSTVNELHKHPLNTSQRASSLHHHSSSCEWNPRRSLQIRRPAGGDRLRRDRVAHRSVALESALPRPALPCTAAHGLDAQSHSLAARMYFASKCTALLRLTAPLIRPDLRCRLRRHLPL